MQNPDPRPLPNGWTEHYDVGRKNWYYVQISVMPPRASHQHPADMRLDGVQARPSRGSITQPSPPVPPPSNTGMPTPSIHGQVSQPGGGSGLSLAQRLYASSNNKESTAPLISTTARDFGNMMTAQAPPVQTSPISIPTSPSYVSPSSGVRPSPTLQTIPRENGTTYIPSMPAPNAADFYNNTLTGFNSSVNSRSSYTPVPSRSGPSSPSYGSTNNEFSSPYPANDSPEAPVLQGPHPDNAQSYQAYPPPPFPTDTHLGSTNNEPLSPYSANDSSETPALQPSHLDQAQSYQVAPPPPFPTDTHIESPNDGFSGSYPATEGPETPALHPSNLDRAQCYQVPPPPPFPTDTDIGTTNNGFSTPYPANDSSETPALQLSHLDRAQSYQVPPSPPLPTDAHIGSTNNGFSSPYPANEGPEAPAFQPSHLHRAQSYQVSPPPPLPTHFHRSATYSANNSSACPSFFAGPRSTRHLSTMAQPPSQTADASGSTPHFQTMASPPQTFPSLSGLPSPSYSEGALSSPIAYPSPPPSFQGMHATGIPLTMQPQASGGSATYPPLSPAEAAQAAALAAQAEQRAKLLKQVGLQVGKTAGKAALKIAGGAVLLSMGIPPHLAVGLGKSAVSALGKAFSGVNTGISPSTLQSVLQGQPGADYQSIINALVQQQQKANTPQLQGPQQTPPVDYQALINELNRIQNQANAQQAIAQQQALQQQALAQIQANALLQQQQQSTAQTLAFSPNPVMPGDLAYQGFLQQQMITNSVKI